MMYKYDPYLIILLPQERAVPVGYHPNYIIPLSHFHQFSTKALDPGTAKFLLDQEGIWLQVLVSEILKAIDRETGVA